MWKYGLSNEHFAMRYERVPIVHLYNGTKEGREAR